jgi:hypothetical protein
MIKQSRATVLALSIFAVSSGWAATAHANATGYVCQSGWTPNPAALASYLSGMGAYGVVYTYVYSAPKCGGSQVGMAYFCTVGATNTNWCALNQLMTEHQAASLASSLQQAGAQGQKVTLYTSGGPNSGVYVEFTQP